MSQYLTDPADKNVVFALLRRLRADLSQGEAVAAPSHHQQEHHKRESRNLQSQEDLLDLDEHDGDLLDVS